MVRLEIVFYRSFLQKKKKCIENKQDNDTPVDKIYSYCYYNCFFFNFYFEIEQIELFHDNREIHIIAEFQLRVYIVRL